jgi:hypothetical protein
MIQVPSKLKAQPMTHKTHVKEKRGKLVFVSIRDGGKGGGNGVVREESCWLVLTQEMRKNRVE